MTEKEFNSIREIFGITSDAVENVHIIYFWNGISLTYLKNGSVLVKKEDGEFLRIDNFFNLISFLISIRNKYSNIESYMDSQRAINDVTSLLIQEADLSRIEEKWYLEFRKKPSFRHKSDLLLDELLKQFDDNVNHFKKYDVLEYPLSEYHEKIFVSCCSNDNGDLHILLDDLESELTVLEYCKDEARIIYKLNYLFENDVITIEHEISNTGNDFIDIHSELTGSFRYELGTELFFVNGASTGKINIEHKRLFITEIRRGLEFLDEYIKNIMPLAISK